MGLLRYVTELPRNILDYRVIIVTGKGGTGKTTVAASLADAARRQGRRVALIETAPIEAIASCFDARAPELGYAGRSVRRDLFAMRLEPTAALAEYLGLQIKLRGLAERVIRTETFGQLLEAVPGWRELIILGKIWHLEQQTENSGRPLFDVIVVDAPATGHGMTFLDVPRVVQQAVRGGPLLRHSGWVEELVHDRDRTLLLPVTLPEELPVSETIELVRRARDEIKIGIDRIVVNAMPDDTEKRWTPALAEVPDDLAFEHLPPIPAMRAMLSHLEQRDELAVTQRKRVSDDCGLPLVDLPFVLEPSCRAQAASPLSEAILSVPVWPQRDRAGRAASGPG